jgi:hypothetical protein
MSTGRKKDKCGGRRRGERKPCQQVMPDAKIAAKKQAKECGADGGSWDSSNNARTSAWHSGSRIRSNSSGGNLFAQGDGALPPSPWLSLVGGLPEESMDEDVRLASPPGQTLSIPHDGTLDNRWPGMEAGSPIQFVDTHRLMRRHVCMLCSC